MPYHTPPVCNIANHTHSPRFYKVMVHAGAGHLRRIVACTVTVEKLIAGHHPLDISGKETKVKKEV